MSHKQEDFLFEIGTEELPAKQLALLQNTLLQNTLLQLEKAQLNFSGEAKAFATPRRLAIYIPNLQIMQPDQVLERKGPSVQSAFDSDGKPTKACEGFAKSCQLTVEQLERRDTPQGAWLFAKQEIKGKAAVELLPQIIEQALEKLPIAKPMHWGVHPQAFLRPVRWLVMMLGNQVIPATFFDLTTSNVTYGHRFLTPEAITITEPKQYAQLLLNAKVIADFNERKQAIEQQLHQSAKILKGHVCLNEALLNEVVGLVEWPEVLVANFAPRFLDVPENALIAAMENHQKSFAIKNAAGKLLPHFLTVANIISKQEKQVIVGNERVMQARLSDAEFFYQKDLLIPLQNYCEDLKKVVFQAQLGTVYAKTKALAGLATDVARSLAYEEKSAYEAGLLAKSDLRTQMVGEFPELQGEMGQIYARQQGLAENIADALFEQYLPRFANDQLPNSHTGIALALADRLLNLVGIFAIGQIPTGEKDPFALRRAAIGVCRIILEKQLRLQLLPLLISAKTSWQNQGVVIKTSDVVDQVYDFIIERLRNLYAEQGVKPQVVQAVLVLRLDDLLDIHERIHAINIFQTLPEAESLAAAQKRVINILQKEKLQIEDLNEPDTNLFELPQEKTLADKLIELQAEVSANFSAKKYALVLQQMAKLKAPIDDFFDNVMVMVENQKLRHNRLCLLAKLSRFLNQVADISQLL